MRNDEGVNNDNDDEGVVRGPRLDMLIRYLRARGVYGRRSCRSYIQCRTVQHQH
jgi:hypothetical protein